MLNYELAQIFYAIADFLDIEGVAWKPLAYKKAARVLENLREDVEVIYDKKGIKGLMEIEGVGQAIAEKIEEYIHTGEIQEYNKLKKGLPKGIGQLLDIGSLGPKKVAVLYKKLKIKNIKDLENAIKKNKIAELPGFGIKTQENISAGIEMMQRSSERMLLGEALPIARKLVENLKQIKEVGQVEIAGSLRRRKETIGDIDILVSSKAPNKVMNAFTSLSYVDRVLAKGETKSSVFLSAGIQADLRVINPAVFGAALQYFTGSKEHNIKLRSIAHNKGYKLSEYGLFNNKTGKLIAGKTEAEIYKKLGRSYIAPELRENLDEIELAKENKLPKLVELKDIKGDFHMHTIASDGINSAEEMVIAAKKFGYKYIAITDHTKYDRIANGLKEDEMLEHARRIRELNKKIKGIKIFAGAEVAILSDGSLDYSDDVLKKLDVVIASLHSGFKQEKDASTKRVLKALDNKYVDIFGHPTGRLIHQREPVRFDLPETFKLCKDRRIMLEINSSPSRLDLKDTDIKQALEVGCNFVINTDSHATSHFYGLEFGVATARRGWATPNHIINTKPLNQLPKYFRKLKI